MSDTKFTPGPLTLIFRDHYPYGVVITDSTGRKIFEQGAAMHGSQQHTRADCVNGVGFYSAEDRRCTKGWSREYAVKLIAEQDANGRLWAAAPDLYAALETLCIALGLKTAHPSELLEWYGQIGIDAIDAAATALRKARGEQ